MRQPTANRPRYLIGWREWITFPDFANARVKAKVDTGARTSAIHAGNITLMRQDGIDVVGFTIYPNQKDGSHAITCWAPLINNRPITNSGGRKEDRFVVRTTIGVGDHRWPIELSLTSRPSMGFRMLLGRSALKSRFLVVPDRSFLDGRQFDATNPTASLSTRRKTKSQPTPAAGEPE